jgi:hypothetical protein
VVLALCALIFVSVLIVYPARGVVRRLRRTVSARAARSRARTAAVVLAIVTSALGLMAIGMLAALPVLYYSGFVGWMDLPLAQRVALHVPLALVLVTAGVLALNVPAWRAPWWSPAERWHYAAIGGAALALVGLLVELQLVGFGFV